MILQDSIMGSEYSHVCIHFIFFFTLPWYDKNILTVTYFDMYIQDKLSTDIILLTHVRDKFRTQLNIFSVMRQITSLGYRRVIWNVF